MDKSAYCKQKKGAISEVVGGISLLCIHQAGALVNHEAKLKGDSESEVVFSGTHLLYIDRQIHSKKRLRSIRCRGAFFGLPV